MNEGLESGGEWSDDEPYVAAEEGLDFLPILNVINEPRMDVNRRETRSGGSPHRHPGNTSRGVPREQSSSQVAAASNPSCRREAAVEERGAVGGAAVGAHAAERRSATTGHILN